eukprot:1512048-Rhodomonas_salina.1
MYPGGGLERYPGYGRIPEPTTLLKRHKSRPWGPGYPGTGPLPGVGRYTGYLPWVPRVPNQGTRVQCTCPRVPGYRYPAANKRAPRAPSHRKPLKTVSGYPGTDRIPGTRVDVYPGVGSAVQL